jgi:hypothetical protein
MRTLIDFTFQYFDLFLIGILIVLVTLFISVFIKNRITLVIVMAILIIGILIFLNQTKYTTLLELYSDQLNEDSVVKSISISINEQSGNMSDKIRSVTIEDEEIIERILEDFSNIELKKEDDIQHLYREYHIVIIVTNKIEEDHLKTTTIGMDLDKNYLDNYRIISETNHLKTIESLAGDKDMDWKDLD